MYYEKGAVEGGNPYNFEPGTESVRSPEEGERILSNKRFSLSLEGPETQLADAARQLESIVFSDKYGDHRNLMPHEYGDYEDKSRFLVVTDEQEEVVAGVIRTMEAESPEDLKTAYDLAEMRGDPSLLDERHIRRFHPNFNAKTTVDVGTLTVAKAYRGKTFKDPEAPLKDRLVGAQVASMLYYGLYRSSKERGITGWTMMLDAHAKGRLEKVGLKFEPYAGIEEPAEYLGSANTYPLYTDVEAAAKGLLKKFRWDSYLVLTQGLGINALLDADGVLRK